MAGLLDWYQDPSTQQLLGLSAGLLSAGGPQRYPTSVGQGLAQGLTLGQQLALGAGRGQLQNAQLESTKYRDALLGMQIRQMDRNQQVQEDMLRRLGMLPGTQGGSNVLANPQPNVQYDPATSSFRPSANSDVTSAPSTGVPGIPPALTSAVGMDVAFNGGKGVGGMLATYAKPFTGRAGAPIWGTGADGKPAIVGFSPKLDEGMTLDSSGNVGVAPGYAAAKTALGTVPNPSAPMQTIKLSNQRELQVTQPEYLNYVQSGGTILPARYSGLSGELPGVRFQDQPAAPSRSSFPKETPAQRSSAREGQISTLNFELQNENAKLASATTPEDKQTAQDNITALQKELRNLGVKPETAVVGASQSQPEAINQAAATEAAKTSAKELTERRVNQPKDLTLLADNVQKVDQAISQAESVLKHPGLDAATGLEGKVRAIIPGTQAYDAAAKLDTLRGQVMLSVLQAFRQASANGSSGFGQLSNAEGDTLRNSITSLDRAQSLGQLKEALTTVIDTLNASKGRMLAGYKRLYGDEANLGSTPATPKSSGGWSVVK